MIEGLDTVHQGERRMEAPASIITGRPDTPISARRRPALTAAIAVVAAAAAVAGWLSVPRGGMADGAGAAMRAVPAAPDAPAAPAVDDRGGWSGFPVRPERPAPNIALTDQAGRPWTLQVERGKVVVLFFGYTRCPDVCPQTMARLKQAVDSLGEAGDDVLVSLVTTDPSHDTPAVLGAYVGAYDPRFIGLTGTMDEVMAAARPFGALPEGDADHGAPSSDAADHDATGHDPASHAAARPVDPTVHSSRVWLIDAAGQLRVSFMGPFTPAEVAHDLAALLAERG